MSRNSEMGLHFYMVECDSKGIVASDATELDLEESFDGLTYMKADGLNNVGKARVYTEKFADSDRLRVYLPETPLREQTTVTLSFVFVGENRYNSYQQFVDYVSSGFHRYRDNARNKYLYFYVEAEIKPAKELMYGGTPYITLDLQVKNIFGQTFDEPIN